MFFQKELEFLGHQISREGVKPTQSRNKSIKDTPAPKNKQELQSFLGLITYNAKFMPSLAHTLYPLHLLLRKNTQWSWKSKHQDAFTAAKELLCEDCMLVHYDVNKLLKLFCDASPHGLGVCLVHVMPNGDERPVVYASHTLSAAEQNYAQIETSHYICSASFSLVCIWQNFYIGHRSSATV